MNIIQGDSTLSNFQLVMAWCFEIMKTKFIFFGQRVSLFDFFLWAILMFALLKMFFSMLE